MLRVTAEEKQRILEARAEQRALEQPETKRGVREDNVDYGVPEFAAPKRIKKLKPVAEVKQPVILPKIKRLVRGAASPARSCWSLRLGV